MVRIRDFHRDNYWRKLSEEKMKVDKQISRLMDMDLYATARKIYGGKSTIPALCKNENGSKIKARTDPEKAIMLQSVFMNNSKIPDEHAHKFSDTPGLLHRTAINKSLSTTLINSNGILVSTNSSLVKTVSSNATISPHLLKD